MNNELPDWLKSEIEISVIYHNHKETMAWTATALFLAGGAAFLAAPPRVAGEHPMVALILLVLTSLAILGFVVMQFMMRWSAADTSEGLRASLTKLHREASQLDLSVSTDDPGGFPKFVATEIKVVRDKKKRFRKEAYKDPRWWSESASYVVMILTTIALMAAIKNPPASEESKLEGIARDLSGLSIRLSANTEELRRAILDSETRLLEQVKMQQPHNIGLQPTNASVTEGPPRLKPQR